MRHSTLLFGPDGVWFRENSRKFLAVLGDPAPDYDATRFAVRNLGFIKMVTHERVIEITLNPHRTGVPALLAAHQAVRSSGAVLVHLCYSDHEGDRAAAVPVRTALAQLAALWPDASPGHPPH